MNNLVIDTLVIDTKHDPVLCIIKATQEERKLFPVYDSNITTGLNVHDTAVGLGKFYGWKDPSTNEIFIAGTEAYPKPLEPYELFGVECGYGWKDLVNPLIEWVTKYNENNPEAEPIVIEQIKEKFGGLRFYVSYAPDELQRMIVKAEGDSYGICELCGSHTDVGHTQGWIQTICRKCLQERLDKSDWKKQVKWKSVDSGTICLITKQGEE